MGFPTDFFPVLFAIPRTVGWLAHWNEFLDDKENKIARPRQVYLGKTTRDYVSTNDRQDKLTSHHVLDSEITSESKRRFASGITP